MTDIVVVLWPVTLVALGLTLVFWRAGDWRDGYVQGYQDGWEDGSQGYEEASRE